MPGYGIKGPDEGSGLLPWSWAEERFAGSRNYWVATVWPDGRPHVMPVWGVWDDYTFWFTSGVRSRKARNIAHDPRCVATTEDADNPVVVEGRGVITKDADEIAHVLALVNDKYDVDYSMDMLDPDENATIRVRPVWAFALREGDFTGSPTRWTFDEG
jgi:general stress protein 26